MNATIAPPHGRLRERLAALLVGAFLASLIVVTGPPPSASAHVSGGCTTVPSHIHGDWRYRARATHLSGSGQTLITWERRKLNPYPGEPNPWRYFNSHVC